MPLILKLSSTKKNPSVDLNISMMALLLLLLAFGVAADGWGSTTVAAATNGCGPNATLYTHYLDLPLTRIFLWDVQAVTVEVTDEALPEGQFRLDLHYTGGAPILSAASAIPPKAPRPP